METDSTLVSKSATGSASATVRPVGQPGLACESCRTRKVKCGRELPQCIMCLAKSRTCRYPLIQQKPGPKVGASQLNRKRIRPVDFPKPNYEIGKRRGSRHNLGTNRASAPREREIMVSSAKYQNQEDITPCNESNTSALPSLLGTEICQTQDYTPPSPSPTILSSAAKSDALSIHRLSFIVHPVHESTVQDRRTRDQEADEGASLREEPVLIARACYALNISPDTLHYLIDLYFDNMTAFSLFRRPSFEAKLHAIPSSLQLNALLASICAYSVRFDTHNEQGYDHTDIRKAQDKRSVVEKFHNLALKFVDEALKECSDERPTLCLLQAMILTTFQQLIKGVRGKAWRALGTCVRVAYELFFHLIDSERFQSDIEFSETDIFEWCLDEERRRAWWAIWEMDTFASTVRRCPTAIGWSQNEVFLPVEDDMWFKGKIHQSCFLEINPIDRWKALQSCGNQSPKAWFITVNSLMREAQLISSPRGLQGHLSDKASSSRVSEIFASSTFKEVSESLAILENCLRCFTIALPAPLKYRNEYLAFNSSNAASVSATRQSHAAKFSIYVMTQLTKFMIFHYKVFRGEDGARASEEWFPDPNKGKCSTQNISQTSNRPDSEALGRYMEAAECILNLVNRCSDDHVQYVNPFLASTIWLAAAIQLVYKIFGPRGTNINLVDSNFKVLSLNYKQYADYWNAFGVLQQNLESLEGQLRSYREPESETEVAERHDVDRISTNSLPDMLSVSNVERVPEFSKQRTNNGWSYHEQHHNYNAFVAQTGVSQINGPQMTIVDPNRPEGMDSSFQPNATYGVPTDTSLGRFDDDYFDLGSNAYLPYYLNGLLSGSFVE